MKITIFIIVHVLKSNGTWKFDISDCHSFLTVQNPVKTVYLKSCSKCLPPAFTQVGSLDKAQYGLVDVQCSSVVDHPYCLQDFLQLVSGIRLVAFKHSSPDMVIKRIKVW